MFIQSAIKVTVSQLDPLLPSCHFYLTVMTYPFSIYPKHWDTSIITIIEKVCFYNAVKHQKHADEMANSVDPDQTAPGAGSTLFAKEQSNMGLHCLLKFMCPNT